MSNRPPTNTQQFRTSISSKAWTAPEPEQPMPANTGIPNPNNDPILRQPLPIGTYHQVRVNYYVSDREFAETHIICLQDGLVMDTEFQDLFLRFWWDEEEGSPYEEDGYQYSDDLWTTDSFLNVVEIPAHVMNDLYAITGERPLTYTRTLFERWLETANRQDNEDEY